MATIRYTHNYDLLCYFLYFFVFIFLGGVFYGLISSTLEFLGIASENPTDTKFVEIVAFVIGVLATYLLVMRFGHLSTFLYCRLTLNAKISFKDAENIEILIDHGGSSWRPMTEIMNLPVEDRGKALLQIYDEEYNNFGLPWEEYSDLQFKTRVELFGRNGNGLFRSDPEAINMVKNAMRSKVRARADSESKSEPRSERE